jgi:hypothetical protein
MLFKDKQPPKNARELAAVAFRRELAREGFTHIPYINDVEDPGSISYIMLVDRPKDSPAVLRDVRAEFDPKKITEPDLRFAEGGMVEDDQMNRLMQEGGMADDGMSREPVTGNEIPPGSLASEVRDDIDVKLSEGEYVIPADVLRYYGVRFFEDLRAQAKQGMMEMEADGRIGGTPVDAQGVPMGGQDEELTPEEEQMLVEALGGSGGGPAGGARTAPARMAYGGMVQQPAPTPYQDQATMYQMPEGMGGPMGMQEGGLTRDGTSSFDRTQFTLPESSGAFFSDSSGAFESRKYINPTTGEEKTVQFLNGVPMGLVPEGFVPWTPALAEQAQSGTSTETPKVEPVEVERGGRDMDNVPTTGSTGEGSLSYDRWAEKNYDAITSDPYGFGVNAISEVSKQATGIGRIFSQGIIGDIQKMEALSDANAALGFVTDAAQKQDLQSRIDALSRSISSPVVGLLADAGFLATGNKKGAAVNNYADLAKATSTAPSTGLAGKPSGTTSDPQRNIPGDTDPSGGVTRSGGRDQQGTSGTLGTGTSPGRSDRDQQGTSGTSAGTSLGRSDRDQQGTSGTSAGTSPGRSDRDQQGTSGGSNATRRAEGGLISKPQKTSRNKKGLAS